MDDKDVAMSNHVKFFIKPVNNWYQTEEGIWKYDRFDMLVDYRLNIANEKYSYNPVTKELMIDKKGEESIFHCKTFWNAKKVVNRIIKRDHCIERCYVEDRLY